VFKEIKALPKTVKHIVFQLGIPIAYRESARSRLREQEKSLTSFFSLNFTARMNFLEKALDSKLNPMFALNKLGMMSGSLNK